MSKNKKPLVDDEGAAIRMAAAAKVMEPAAETRREGERRPDAVIRWHSAVSMVFPELSLDNLVWQFGTTLGWSLTRFFVANPEAPEAAGLIHLAGTENIILLPDQDPRRVLLAVKLFRTAVLGIAAIEREDNAAEALRQQREAAALAPPVPVRDAEKTMRPVEHGFGESDLAKALAGRKD